MAEVRVCPPDYPMGIGPRFRYESLVARIVAGNGEWVRIDPTEIQGAHNLIKQTRLIQAGRHRGLKFTTTFRCPGWCFARLVSEGDGKVVTATGNAATSAAVSQ